MKHLSQRSKKELELAIINFNALLQEPIFMLDLAAEQLQHEASRQLEVMYAIEHSEEIFINIKTKDIPIVECSIIDYIPQYIH